MCKRDVKVVSISNVNKVSVIVASEKKLQVLQQKSNSQKQMTTIFVFCLSIVNFVWKLIFLVSLWQQTNDVRVTLGVPTLIFLVLPLLLSIVCENTHVFLCEQNVYVCRVVYCYR